MNQPRTTPQIRRTRHASAGLGLAAAGLLVAAIASTGASPAYAAEAPVGLGTAESFSVLAGSTITNTGPTVVSGDLGLAPGTAITGFPPGVVQGTTHNADAVAGQAKVDLTTAYNDAAGRSTTETVSGDIGGRTLVSGVYTTGTSLGLTGSLTLDAQGDPNAVFIFQAGSTLTSAANSSVSLINGASPCNVFWQVGSSATLGTGTSFVGTIMANTSISLTTGATMTGRALASTGAVTLDTNVITAPSCAAPVVTPTASPTTTPSATPTQTPTAAPTKTPTATASPSDQPNDTTTDNGTSTPPVPVGNPPTGLGGAEQQGGNTSVFLFLLAGLVAAAAVAVPTLGNRFSRRR